MRPNSPQLSKEIKSRPPLGQSILEIDQEIFDELGIPLRLSLEPMLDVSAR